LEWYESRKDKRSESYRTTVEKSFKRDIFSAFGSKDIKSVKPYDVLKCISSDLIEHSS